MWGFEMNNKLHPTLQAKLARTKTEYQKVTAFAELLPMFSNKIIDGEFTGDNYSRICDRYGKLYLAWGVNWYTNTPTNYPKEKHSEVGFVNVYINTYSLFGDKCASFASQELGKVLPSISVHFYDGLNSTFYFLPHEAEDGLNKLESWFVETSAKCAEYLKQKRKAELERELEQLK